MKRRFLIVFLSIICSVCLASGISACTLSGGTDSTLVMEEGVVYFTDFSIKYTSATDSPNGDINESTLSDEIDGSVQSYYLVMDFNMQLASNTDGREYITVKFVVLDANMVETIVNYADTSNVSAITSDGQTTITATYSLPDKAKSVKNINLVLELKPKTTGATDIYYYFSSDTKQIGSYTDEDITYNYTNSNISISNTSLKYTLNGDGQSYSVTGIGTKNDSIIYIKSTYSGLPVTSIIQYAFYKCTTLESITLPDSVTSIGYRAFYECTALTSITIPDSMTSIGSYAFYECTALTSITIPDSMTSIGGEAFGYCTALTSITIPDSVTSIGVSAFYNTAYYNDTNNWENDVLYIGNCLIKADAGISGSYTIKDETMVIATSAFSSCSSLTSITIPNSVTSIGDSAFNWCTALTSITISNSVTFIGDSAFFRCRAITKITIPNSVTSIGDYAFLECTSLISINVDSGNTVYKSIDGNLYSYDGTTLIQYAIGKTDTSFTIPDSVTSIGNSAFKDCAALTSITIPDNVTFIGKSAFYGCKALESVTFENTNGWYVTQNEGTSGTTISSSKLSDTSTVVAYLTNTYSTWYYWYRK